MIEDIRKDKKDISCDIRKSEKFFKWKNVNLTKQEQFFKGFAITYNVEILLSFDPEQTVQLKRN